MAEKRNPWTISLVVLVIWAAIVFAGELLQAGGTTGLDELVSNKVVIALVLAPVFLLVVVAYLKWWKAVGLQAPHPARSLLLAWLPALYIVGFLVLAAVQGLPAGSTILFVLINTLLVGVSEELMFRGILWHGASSRYGLWTSVAITAVVFGGIHALNGAMTGDYAAAVAQAGQAMLFGVWILALRLRQNSIIPAMIIHWLWDFVVFLSAGSGAGQQAGTPGALTYLMPLVFELPLFLYGLWLLRGYQRQQGSVQ